MVVRSMAAAKCAVPHRLSTSLRMTQSSRVDALHFFLVLYVGLGRQQHPESVDAECGAERDVEEERNKAQRQGERPRPWLSVKQTPSGDKSRESLHDHEDSQETQERVQEGREVRMFRLVEYRIRHDGRDCQEAIERGQRQPKNSEKANVLADPTAPRISRHRSRNFFSASATKTLVRL